MSHPKLPDYQIAQVRVIPWDPGHSAAYDLGLGVARTRGAHDVRPRRDLRTDPYPYLGERRRIRSSRRPGLLPAGAKTTENHFAFSNVIVRTGLARDIPLDSLRVSVKSLPARARAGAPFDRLYARPDGPRDAGRSASERELDGMDEDVGVRGALHRPRGALRRPKDHWYRPSGHRVERQRVRGIANGGRRTKFYLGGPTARPRSPASRWSRTRSPSQYQFANYCLIVRRRP